MKILQRHWAETPIKDEKSLKSFLSSSYIAAAELD